MCAPPRTPVWRTSTASSWWTRSIYISIRNGNSRCCSIYPVFFPIYNSSAPPTDRSLPEPSIRPIYTCCCRTAPRRPHSPRGGDSWPQRGSDPVVPPFRSDFLSCVWFCGKTSSRLERGARGRSRGGPRLRAPRISKKTLITPRVD